MGGVAANGDGATRTSAAMGSSSWAWRRAWRVDETSHRKGAHVHHRGRRPQAQTGRLGARRIRQGGARPVPPTADRRAARLHQGSHRRRSRMDRRQREGAPAERRARPGLVPHRLPDERRARPGQETVAEPGPARQRQDGDRGDARRQIRRDGSSGLPTAASPRSSNYAGRPADARTTSPKPSDSATPTPGPRHSTTRSRSPSAWPMASDTSTTSSP